MTYDFSENIQRAIIYLSKTDKNFLLQIITLIKPEYFEFPSHTKLFTVIKDYFEKYNLLPTDDFILEEVKQYVTSRDPLSDFEDELVYINKINKQTIDNVEYVLTLIEKFAKKEAMKSAIAQSILLLKQDKFEDVEALVRDALIVGRTVDIGQIYFNDVSPRWQRFLNGDKNVVKHKTILKKLNDSLEGGLSNKELAMVVAPPGVGKSLFLVNQGVKSMMEGKKVLYVSLEMSEDKIAQRFDSIMTLVPQAKLKETTSQLTVLQRIETFKSTFEGSDLVIKEFPTGEANVNTVRSLLFQLQTHKEFKPDVLIVDYLELLRPTREIDQEYRAQQRIAEELRGLGMKENILVWTATQTNRQGKAVKVITDAELGDSYGKIRTCDFAVSLNQSEEEFDSGTMRAYVMKSRNGRARFQIPMKVDYGTLTMTEDSRELDEDE